MNVKEIKASSIISKSNLPGIDYVINPYVGCSHACVYCYARFMKRFTGHSEDWGKFVDIKTNAPELIPDNTRKYYGKSFFMSSVTDPYSALEKKYELTRKILKKLISYQPKLKIQSKSSLIVRDIDVLKQFNNCEAGFSITTLDDNLRKEIEPFTSTVEAKIKALEELKIAGIRTYVFIGPIIPYVTDWKAIIENTKHCTDSYLFENLNIAGTVWHSVKKWLNEYHPYLVNNFEDAYSTKSVYWDHMESEINQFCKKNNIDYIIGFHHGKK